MKKNYFFIILVLVLVFSAFLNIYFFVWIKYNSDNIITKKNNIKFTWNTLNYKNNNNKQKIIKLSVALTSIKPFNSFINEIKGKYNLVDIIINEFKKVKNKEGYLNLRKKFWWDILLYAFMKIRNIKLSDKYMSYYLKLNLKFNEKKIKKSLSFFNEIIEEYYKNGYYDKLNYKDKEGTYDYFRLSLMNYSLDKKIKICKEWFKKEDDFNSCKRVVIYMAANKENKYCEKMDGNYYKKWCNDTLDYLDKK